MAKGQKNIAQTVTDLILPHVNDLGYSLWDVEYVKEGASYYLRITIDRENGVSIDDCEEVSRWLSDELDRADLIKEAYVLEVSSPGIERKLKKQQDFDRFLGSEVLLKLFSAINGTKKLQGILISRDSEKTVIEVNSENIEVPNDKISKANIVYQG